MKRLFSFFKKKERIVDYTHWDIHALARIIDPSAWAEFDSLPMYDPTTGRKKYYGSFLQVHDSFNIAIRLLKSGIMATEHHIWSDADLSKYLKSKNEKI